MNESLEVGGLTFEVRRSARRKTLGLTVDRGGELVIHATAAAGDEELARWTRSKLLWVHRKLALKEETAPRVREPEFVSGESFSYLGRSSIVWSIRPCSLLATSWMQYAGAKARKSFSITMARSLSCGCATLVRTQATCACTSG